MASIKDYMFDTSIIEEVLNYLNENHGIHVVVVDNADKIVPINSSTEKKTLPQTVTFPFESAKNIGGLQCCASDQAVLDKAAPHIQMCLKSINTLLESELEFKEASDEILLLSSQLNFTYKLAEKLIGINNLNDFCNIVLEEISSSIKADGAFIATKDRWGEQFTIPYKLSAEEVTSLRKKPSFKKAFTKDTIIFTLKDRTCVLTTPIREKDGIIGYIAFIRSNESKKFTTYDKKIVSIMDNIVSPSIETLRLYDSLQDLYINTVKALAMAIDAKDPYTHGHSYRVAKYSVAIGRQLNIPQKNRRDLEIAAYMHDLGKIGIAEHILGKPGMLTKKEFDEVKKHPEMTDKILEPIHLPDFIVDAAVQHHERLDGGGYPYGLKGDNICAFARIIAVADVFDAMTSKRPYRDAMPVEKALKIICNGAQKEFDKQMVVALISSLQDKNEDQEIAQIYNDLNFSDLQGLNKFLVDLSNTLSAKGNKDDQPFRLDDCKPLIEK